MRPQGPERLYRTKRRNFLDSFFIAYDFISRCALLAEPENPSMGELGTKTGLIQKRVRTYVFLRGCTAGPFGDAVLGEDSFKRSEETAVESVVEKCFEDGNRERGGAEVGVDACEGDELG